MPDTEETEPTYEKLYINKILRDQLIIELYNTGITQAEIARRMQLSRERIRQILREAGYKPYQKRSRPA